MVLDTAQARLIDKILLNTTTIRELMLGEEDRRYYNDERGRYIEAGRELDNFGQEPYTIGPDRFTLILTVI